MISGFSSREKTSFLFEMSLGNEKCLREAVNSFKMLKPNDQTHKMKTSHLSLHMLH